MWRLMALCVTHSSSAARDMLLLRAVASNARSALSGGKRRRLMAFSSCVD
jgi:hypothetical protein